MADLKERFETASEEVVRAKAVLAQAEASRDAIFEQIIRTGSRYSDVHNPPAANGAVKPVKGAAAKILAVLTADASKEWNYQELEQKVPDVPRASIRAYLFKLQRSNRVSKVGRGSWKAM